MYRIIKVLNNNGILAYHNETKKERIFLGNGIGFGKKTGEQFENIKNAKIYSLVTRKKQQSALKVVNTIAPVYLEAAGKIIEAAEQQFSEINRNILLPLADHIALAAKRAKDRNQIPNPFTTDIRILFPKEYEIALKGKAILMEMTGYEISDDEAGFIALHIHSGLADEKVSETLDTTRIINTSIGMIEKHFTQKISVDSLSYTRLMSHLYYMMLRTRKGESVNVDLNDFISVRYPRAGKAAEEICSYLEKELKKEVAKEEIGFLAIHIQRVLIPAENEKTED